MLDLAGRFGPTPLLPDRADPPLARALQLVVFSEAALGMWRGALDGQVPAKLAA